MQTSEARDTVRVLLFNNNKLLLMKMEDFNISSQNGSKHRIFWCTVGGKVEKNETYQQAALREIYEETGISQENIKLGPIVWFHEVALNLKGRLTRFKESYIVAHTETTHASLLHPTQDEQDHVKELKWFSIQEINDSKEMIFPIFLKKYLPDIINKNYPYKTLTISSE